MLVSSQNTNLSTFLGLVFLQNILEVVEELILVDPSFISEHRSNILKTKKQTNKQTNKTKLILVDPPFISEHRKYVENSLSSLFNKQTNKPTNK